MRHDRLADKVGTTARAGSDLVTMWRDVGPILAEAVPHFEAPCFFTVDPSSLLITSHFQEGLPEIPAEWLGREYAEGDFNSSSDVLLSETGFGTLHEATRGRPELSRKFHEEMEPFGCDQELLVALRTRDGQSWGLVGLYRELGQPEFTREEIDFLRGVAPSLAGGARHGLLLGQALEPDLPDAPGLVVFDQALRLISATPNADDLLKELGGDPDAPPVSVLAVAGSVLREAHDDEPALSRVLTDSQHWFVLHGSWLVDNNGDRRVAVMIRRAQASHLAPLLMRAYGLTARERDVTERVLRGASTAQVAATLFISEQTVQQHLKGVFAKTGVRSRRELVSSVFQSHYEPRVRDNERRTTSGHPSRDGPMPMHQG